MQNRKKTGAAGALAVLLAILFSAQVLQAGEQDMPRGEMRIAANFGDVLKEVVNGELNAIEGGAYAAIARCRATGKMGFSYNDGSQKEAERHAKKKCGSDCEAIISFKDAYGVCASADDNAYGTASAATQDVAVQNAMTNCRQYSNKPGTCTTALVVHSSQGQMASGARSGGQAASGGGSGKSQSNTYGSIARSSSTGRMGWAWSYGTQRDAEREAVKNCVSNDCATILWFRDAYGAYAGARDKMYGTGWASTQQAAVQNAVSKCRQSSRQPDTCSAEVVVHSKNGEIINLRK